MLKLWRYTKEIPEHLIEGQNVPARQERCYEIECRGMFILVQTPLSGALQSMVQLFLGNTEKNFFGYLATRPADLPGAVRECVAVLDGDPDGEFTITVRTTVPAAPPAKRRRR